MLSGGSPSGADRESLCCCCSGVAGVLGGEGGEGRSEREMEREGGRV